MEANTHHNWHHLQQGQTPKKTLTSVFIGVTITILWLVLQRLLQPLEIHELQQCLEFPIYEKYPGLGNATIWDYKIGNNKLEASSLQRALLNEKGYPYWVITNVIGHDG